MSKRELERITRVWQKRLNLTDWDIRLSWTRPVPRETDAIIKIHDHHEQATIRIGREYRTWDARLANHVIVHELLHVFEHETRRPAAAWSNGRVGGMFWEWYCAGAERWVDKLAVAIIELGGNA